AGTDPASVFRLIADEALKLTGAQGAFVLVPTDDEAPSADVTTLVVAETAGSGAMGAGTAIPVAGTAIGRAFVDRTPLRVEKLEVGSGPIAAGPAVVLRLRTTETVAGV